MQFQDHADDNVASVRAVLPEIAAKTSKYIDYEQRTVGNEDIL